MRNSNHVALRLAMVIAASGALWVFVSNDLLGNYADDTPTLTLYHTWLEWCYVLVASILSYFLTRFALDRQFKIESDLRESEGRLRLFVEHAPAALALFDREMKYLAASRRWIEDCGLDRDGVIGRSHYEVFPEIPDKWKDLHRKALAGEVLRSEKDRFVRMDGSVRWLRWEIRPWGAGEGKSGGIVIFAEDITERIRAQEALSSSEMKYRELFENSRDALLLCMPPSMKFSSVNRAALNMFGAEKEEDLLSCEPWEISPELQPDGTSSEEKAASMQEIAIRKGSNFFEWTHKRLDGSTFPSEVLLSRMKVRGETVILGSIRDISERKQFERDLQDRQKILGTLQKSQIASQTASAIAHELRQPLLAIASYGEAAQMILKSEKPSLERIGRAVEGCATQALRAGKSIQEMLELLGIGEFSVEEFDMNREIRLAISSLRSETGTMFRAELDLDETLLPVKANRLHAQKVLYNLFNNSIEAMQGAGMSLQEVSIRVNSGVENGLAKFSIGDEGPGFDAGNQGHLFEPFFTTKPKGMGMGLVISRSLIETNGGKLWLDPDTTRGAIFHFTLPLSK